MKKKFIGFLLLLGIVFLAVSIFKKSSDSVLTEAESSELKEDSSKIRQINFWNYYNQATEFRLRGNPSKAAEFYKRALEIDSVHHNSLYHLGNTQLAMGNFEEARKSWKRLVESNATSARGHMQLGNMFSCRDSTNPLFDLANAAIHFDKSAQLNREETGPLLQLAKIDLVQNQNEEAIEKLKDVVASNFKSEEAYFLLGYISWRRGDFARARELLEKSVLIVSGAKEFADIGEGETKKGSSPMLTESFRCRMFSDSIKRLVYDAIQDRDFKTDEIYQLFDSEIQFDG